MRYRISRNAVVLLGNYEEESKTIFSKVKNLYDKRSQVVDTGKSNIIKEADLLKLRYYTRWAIKKIYLMKKSKDVIMDLLNSKGFVDKFLG